MYSVSTCPLTGQVETGDGVGSNTLFKPSTLLFINKFFNNFTTILYLYNNKY